MLGSEVLHIFHSVWDVGHRSRECCFHSYGMVLFAEEKNQKRWWQANLYRVARKWLIVRCKLGSLTCTDLKGIRGKPDSRVEHARSHRAAPLAAPYTALTSECSCYITMFCYKSVAGFIITSRLGLNLDCIASNNRMIDEWEVGKDSGGGGRTPIEVLSRHVRGGD
jgi:hypothetical protein